ncbi:transporter [uncultured Chitinophaga sp.]|jgi:hypothetical protein|uniref:transporter n=1 Tax=uncultured Chitinophaga sp. TaxID=339340 RepID=UPI00263838E7|nr:transporter [uncultured Chitinophaga sp.]
MKKTIKKGIAGLALLTAFALTTQAQSMDNGTPTKPATATERPRYLISVGPEANLPLGDFKDAYDWSIGGSVQGEYAILKRDLYVTLNAGYTNFFAKDIAGFSPNDLHVIPVKAGLKYYPVSNFYVQGQAGAAFLGNKSDVGADKSAVFAYSPQVGYLFPLGNGSYLDAGVKFEGYTKMSDGGKSSNFLGLRVAYGFGK